MIKLSRSTTDAGGEQDIQPIKLDYQFFRLTIFSNGK